MKYVGFKKILLAGGVLVVLKALPDNWNSFLLQKEVPVLEQSENRPLTIQINTEKNQSVKMSTIQTQGNQLNYQRNDGTIGTIQIEDTLTIEQLEHYCEVFSLDKTIAYNLARPYFTSKEFKETFCIPGTTVRSKVRSFPTEQAGIIAFLRTLKQIPERFGYRKEDVFHDYSYQTDLSDEELIDEICSVFGNQISKEFVLSVLLHESWEKTSNAYVGKNNGFGYFENGSLKAFENREQATIYAVMNFVYQYVIDQNLNPNDENFIHEVQKIHTPIGLDDPDNLNVNWVSGVEFYFKKVKQDYNCYNAQENNTICVASTISKY